MERKPSRPRRAVTRPFTISLKEGQLYNNRYEILRTAAFGGMSRIYEAIDTESGEKVALKVLSLSKIDDLLIRRFEREVQILQSLRHPNLVRAIDHGSTINGDLYLVLEWLKGLDLGDVMEEKVMGIREALEIGRGVLRGLEVVHQAGIVHRDLKPANVFVLENAQPPSGIKLLDFGVAKLVDEQMLSSVNRPLTSAGMVVGTPYYMSPEQAQGSSDIDHRADLFAIGAALYEMISGVRCYSASSALALLVKIATEEPEPIRSVMPNINDDVNDFLTKALKKKLDERFQSAREMEEAVAKVISTIEQDSPSTNRHVPSFEDGTERMDAVMLSDALNANMVEVEDLEVATSSEHKDKSSDANEITLPENRASDLEEAHPTMVIAQLTGFTQEPSSVMIHFQNAVESLGGTFKLIRRSLALGEFTNGLGMVGRALAASRETIQSVEQLRTDASIKGSIRISLTTALKASGPVDQLIDLACAQIEYAEPGEIIIDNNVREFGGEDLKSKTLRPGKHVVLSYQGIALAHSKDAKAGHLRNLPYSGRNEQLEVLFERSQTFIQQKTPKALLISGGLGMGKSRFIWDLKEKIDQLLPKSTVLITQCSRESRALPVQAITDALRRSCVIRIGENEETRFEKLLEVVPQNLTKPKRIQTQETLAQLLEDADPSIETYPPTIPATESTSSQRKNILQLHSDLSDFLLSCATNPALIFMVDDAHWCDRSSMNILEHLLNTKNIPFVLFLMVSPNQMSGSAIELLENVSKIENHELVALDVSATKTFAQAALQTPVSQEFAAKLTERTGGNPYYLEELLHSFIDAEDKSDKALREKLNAVPSNLYALINSRIQKLAEAETIFLSRAAVFGTHFWVQGLCALGIDNPQECIETLESADFIFPLETSRFSGSREYAFRNTLIRDVAYQAIRGAN